MKKESSYLSERVYGKECVCLLSENSEKSDYWRKLLGDKNFEHMLDKNKKFNHYLIEDDYGLQDLKISKRLLQYLTNSGDTFNSKDVKVDTNQVFFEPFYRKILKYYNNNLANRLEAMKDCFTEKIYRDFSYHLANELQNICIRTLIVQMHIYRQVGSLSGATPEEQYQFYCNECINKAKFYKEIFEKYPVLYRCIVEKAEKLTDYYVEVVNHFWEDRSEIGVKITNVGDPQRITAIIGGFSDSHNEGKQVLQIQFDGGKGVLYKPHSMENESAYYKLLDWISGKVGIQQLKYSFISRENYSWSDIVHYETCNTDHQLKEYYKRFGVQLFLTSFLGTKDLHYENIIASGEYPVLVDLEVLVDSTKNEERITATQEIYYQLSQSVLYTGLLPIYYWNHDGDGVNTSGINGAGGQRYPFKSPVIVNGGTSKMKIEYCYPTSKDAYNLATLRGKFCEPTAYKKEIMEGFCKAYYLIMKQKEEFAVKLGCLKKIKNRFLAADTQRYSMMISASYHPDLLKNGADREVFFYGMWKGRKYENGAIINEEVRAMLHGDIPYFFCYADKTALFSEKKIIESTYFHKTIEKQICAKLAVLCEKDLLRQVEYIGLSLNLISDKKDIFQNQVYDVSSKSGGRVKQEEGMFTSADLISRVLNYAVWNPDRTEVNWPIVQLALTGQDSCKIKAMNHYLYDGLAGMLLLFYELYNKKEDSQIRKIYETLKSMLYRYTDKGYEGCANLDSKNTGAYDGESSIIYVYLILYQQNRDGQYLSYAKKHAEIIEKLIGTDRKYDLLSGNAGAAWVLILLYRLTGNDRYLCLSVEAVNVLVRFAEKQHVGVGWIVEKGMPPMTGVAHGNSGILMPVLALWKYTGEEKYQILAEQIWSYEDSLYSPQIKNWRDMRSGEKTIDMVGNVAWCHGAAGILYTRMICYELIEENKWRTRLIQDIQRAYCKLKQYWKRDSYCLCHGTLGNLWILELVEKKMTEYEMLDIEEESFKNERRPDEKIFLLAQEQMNPGFFDGYGGILYYLVKKR